LAGVICRADVLVDGGVGVRFQVRRNHEAVPAFAIRFRGRVYAYLNRCAHQHVELDWNPGIFFDNDKRLLICATHGALYDPVSGACAGGRCRGAGGLIPLVVHEENGQVILRGPDELNL
jgi:nitrite reductase/ring-hydroxylating ferredoxin subunit